MYDKRWTLALETLLDVFAITWAAFMPGDQSASLLIVVLFLFALDGVYLVANSSIGTTAVDRCTIEMCNV